MKKVISILLALTMVFSLAACSQDAKTGSETKNESQEISADEPIVLKIATTVPDSSPSGAVLHEVFKPEVEKRTNGKVKVEVYNNGVLGGDRQLLEAMQLGTLEADVAPLSVVANFDPACNASELPFLFRNKETAYAALDGEFGQMLAKNLPSKGLRVITYMENSFRNIATVDKKINSLEDMSGVKMRVMESPIYLSMFKSFGSNPTPMAFSELYTALQQKTVEGHDNGVVLTYTNKLYEPIKYYLRLEQNYAATAVIVSEQWWQGLPPEIQQAITEASQVATEWQRAENTKSENELIEEIKKAGVDVYEVSDEEKAKFKEAAMVVYDEMEAVAGKEIIDAAREVDAKYGK
ncbi:MULTISPECIES: TRAP transporter substrate-binding protein [unclassified Sedimentibacter]|uniref:TRAP transporter substrate-binding protein n=1 Tax=unclassified Sedimentibacter TaxID=2649220 RepID=UPI0027E1D8F7|nr:TRAP transporter substrate-binding protein [Sedimentibacter sp. MB35-C1]WMJ77197.1 TRAP transporter substrate-binding protein [Sedimentibacter sp. MB35-C1]